MDLEIETEREVVGERREEKESPELSCLLPLWRIFKRRHFSLYMWIGRNLISCWLFQTGLTGLIIFSLLSKSLIMRKGTNQMFSFV